MVQDSFGKGERMALDRVSRPQNVPYESELFPHEGFFHNLRKVFHTFMYDMKEFLVDFYGVSTEDYVNTLFWLTYLQSWVYEVDTMLEMGRKVDLDEFTDEFTAFLKEHELLTPFIRDNLLRGIREFWKDESIRERVRDPDFLDGALGLKCLDVTLSRRVAILINDIDEDTRVLDIWNTFDKIREVFDDVRDLCEDAESANTNIVLGLLSQGEGLAKEKILTYIDDGLMSVEGEIIHLPQNQRATLGGILGKLRVERLYYVEMLKNSPNVRQQITEMVK